MKSKSNIFLSCLLLYSNFVFAEDEKIELETVVVESKRISSKKTKINTNKINSGLVVDENDLIKHEVGISVTDGGRSGNNGYTIRGLDKDRISLKVDGIESSESFSPTFHQKQGFISGVRNSEEIENLANLEIDKGSNSVDNGGNSLGGSVMMKTKNVDNFVRDGQNVGFYSKSAYSSKNQEYRYVLGGGFRANKFEGLFQYTNRNGKETQSYYGREDSLGICGTLKAGKAIEQAHESGIQNEISKLCGYSRIYADPMDYTSHAYLFKLGYRPNQKYFLNFFYDKKDIKNDIYEKSFQTTGGLARTTSTDKTPYQRYGIEYKYTPENNFINKIDFQIARQNVEQIYNSQTKTTPDIYPDLPPILRYTYTKQEVTQANLNLKTSSIELFNSSHEFKLGLGALDKKFENKNFFSSLQNKIITIDKQKIKRDGFFTYTRPVDTKNYFLNLQDTFWLNDKLSLDIGTRYDRYNYKIKNTNLLGYNKESTKNFLKLPTNKNLNSFTYKAGLLYEITPAIFISYDFNKAFRAPKVEEMFIEFRQGKKVYKSNYNLKPETANNHEITIEAENDLGIFSTTLFYTKYNNFIDYNIKNSNEQVCDIYGCKPSKDIIFKYENINSAEIKGIEFNSYFNGSYIGLDHFHSTLKASYQKGKKSDGTSLMSISPFTLGASTGYKSANNKLQIELNGKYQNRKKAKDTKYKLEDNSGISKADEITIKEYPYLSNSYFVLDLTASYSVNKYLRINCGIFNILDKKYASWNTIREARKNGTMTPLVAENKNVLGLERYTSAGRNFGISFEIKY